MAGYVQDGYVECGYVDQCTSSDSIIPQSLEMFNIGTNIFINTIPAVDATPQIYIRQLNNKYGNSAFIFPDVIIKRIST